MKEKTIHFGATGYRIGKKGSKKIPTMVWVVFGVLAMGALAIATTISDTGITNVPYISNTNISNFWFGVNAGDVINEADQRLMVSEQDTDLTVCASGCNYTTIQEAINQVPYMLRHKYRIFVRNGDYDENLWIPPIIISDILDSDEGSVDGFRITGNCTDYSKTIINSIHITSVQGAIATNINCFTIDNIDPYDDENVSVAIYGSYEAQLGNLNITGNSKYGIVSYASNVDLANIYFNGPENGVLGKRMSIINAGDLSGNGLKGIVSGDGFIPNSGFIDIVNSTGLNVGDDLVSCGSKSGFAKEGKLTYCVNEFTEYIKNMTVTSSNVANSGFWVLRDTDRTQFWRSWVDDSSSYFISEQDENLGSNGNFIFQLDNDGTSLPYFLIEGKSGNDYFKINANGSIIITNLTGTGNDYVCVNSVGALYRSDSACS